MAVPVPVTLSLVPPPSDWTASSPGLFQSFLDLISASLSGSMPNLLMSGQVGGVAPSTDIGPWVNGTEWWFYQSGGYAPTEQGCPVGTVAIWGAKQKFPSSRWLYCNGSAVSRNSYSKLYSRIGNTWGAGDGHNTFNLPPSGKFYLNAANFSADPSVPIQVAPPSSLGVIGGEQLSAPFTAAQLPQLKITIPYVVDQTFDAPSSSGAGVTVPNITQTGGSPPYAFPVTDEKTPPNDIGASPQPIPIMPPFVVINFMIKFL